MESHVIKLPSAVAMHQVRSVLANHNFFPEAPPDAITLRFHPEKTYLDPMGVSLLGAWASYWRDRGVSVRCENMESKGLVYAARMGLLEALETNLPNPVAPHEEAGRFVQLTRIATQDDLGQFCAAIGGLLRVPHLTEFVQYVVAEIARNTLEHAGAAAFVSAQYYERDKRVTIGVADCGRGIRQSLQSNYGFSDDRSAILAAMRPGVSGTTRHPYSAPDNAGLGLFYARGVAKASARPFILLSGSAAFRQRGTTPSAMPSRNPEDEPHDIFHSFPAWQGTVVGINVRGFDGNLSSFMARMKPLLNIGAAMRRIPRLRFT